MVTTSTNTKAGKLNAADLGKYIQVDTVGGLLKSIHHLPKGLPEANSRVNAETQITLKVLDSDEIRFTVPSEMDVSFPAQ